MAASGCFEYFDTASCQPPTVAADFWPAPCGSGATANLPLTFEPLAWAREYAYGQLRMKAALPLMNAVCVSPSWYEVTPRGVVLPMFARNMLRTFAALALLI